MKDSTLIKQIADLIDAHTKKQNSQLGTYRVRISKLTRQRDEAVGRAREYRTYATKYQKELAELRKNG